MNVNFQWSVSDDPLRSGSKVHTTDLADAWIVVQEVTVTGDGTPEWGWMICAEPAAEGDPTVIVAMRNGYPTVDASKSAAEKFALDAASSP